MLEISLMDWPLNSLGRGDLKHSPLPTNGQRFPISTQTHPSQQIFNGSPKALTAPNKYSMVPLKHSPFPQNFNGSPKALIPPTKFQWFQWDPFTLIPMRPFYSDTNETLLLWYQWDPFTLIPMRSFYLDTNETFLPWYQWDPFTLISMKPLDVKYTFLYFCHISKQMRWW